MANLFDKLSGTLSKLSDDKPTTASTELRKNSSKSSADSHHNEGNSGVDDQGSVANNQDGANGSKNQSGGRVENETQGVQQYVIPKKNVQKSGLFVDLMINSREFQHEILPAITKNYKFSTSSSRFSYVKVQSVHNKELMNQYLEKRKDLRKHGYNEKEIGDSVAFVCVEKEEQARKICSEGLSIGNMKDSLLGDPSLGVQLSRHSDVLTATPFPPLFSGYLVLFKVIKGRVKTVIESESHLEPTPNHDCHISGSISNEPSVSHESLYFATQIYMYEYGENSLPVQRPRSICPISIVHFLYDSDRIKGSKGVPATGFMHSHGLNYNVSSAWHGNYDDQEEYVVWTGNLTVKSLYACLVNMKSIGSCIKPAKIGQHINITHKMEANQARRKYLPNVCGLHRRAEGHWNGTYINVCELHPEDNESKGHFQRIMNYLGKHNSVAIVKVDKETVLLLLPASELSYHLGLSKPHQYPVLLYCLFLSKKSMKHRVGASDKTSQKSGDSRKQLRISVPNSPDHGHHSPSIRPTPIHSAAFSQGMTSPKPKWSTPTKESPNYRPQTVTHPGTPSPTSITHQWNRPHPPFSAQGSSPGKPWVTSPPLSTCMPPPSSSQFLPPSPSHFPPQSVSSLSPSPSLPPSLTLPPSLSMPASPVHQNPRFPLSPSFQTRSYPSTPEHNGMNNNNFHHLNPAFSPIYSSPSKYQMGPQGMAHSPQSGHSAYLSHSSHLSDIKPGKFEPPRTPPSDPRLHSNQRSPNLSQYRDLTPTKSLHDTASRNPYTPTKYNLDKLSSQQTFLSSGTTPVGSTHSSRYVTATLTDAKRPSMPSNMNFDNGFKPSPVPASLLTKDKIKKEFLSQMEIQEVKQRLKAKLAKAEAEKEQPVEMTESEMEIIKRGHKTKSSSHLDPHDGNKKSKSEKKKPVSPALSKEANEMKEFLDSGLDKKKKFSEKKPKPSSNSEKASEKKPLSIPSQSQAEKPKASIEAVKINVPELKLDSLEDIAKMRRMVDLEIQKGKERMPKLEEERKRLAAELEGKSKMKLEKRKKHPSEICDEEPKEKVARREDLNTCYMKEKTKSGIDKSKISPTTQTASDMCDFLNQDMEDVELTPDAKVSKGHDKTLKSSDKMLEKDTPYSDLIDDIKTVSRDKTHKEEESYKGKKKMTVRPMIEEKTKKYSRADESGNKKEKKEDSKSDPKLSRWDSVTKKINERRGTEGSSDGEGERKVEKKNGGKIIIIREIKYVDKKEKDGHSDSDASNSSRSKHSKKSKDSKRKLKEHRHSESEKSKRERESRHSKGLVKYSDSDTCSEKSHGSRESSLDTASSDYLRLGHSSGDSKAKRFKSDERSRVVDESGDHRDRDRGYDMYQNRISKDGRNLGPRNVVGLSTSHRSHKSQDRSHRKKPDDKKSEKKSQTETKRKVKSWVQSNKVKSNAQVTINGIVTKDEVSHVYKIPKLPKIPKRKKSTDAQLCSRCSLLCRSCDCSTACTANENVPLVSCETLTLCESSNQNLPQNDSKMDKGTGRPAKSKCDKIFDVQGERGKAGKSVKESDDTKKSKRKSQPKNSISGGAETSKWRSRQSILESIMSAFKDGIRKSKSESGKLETNTKARLSTADSILEEMAEINEATNLMSEAEDNDDVFIDGPVGKDDKSYLGNTLSCNSHRSSSLSVNAMEASSVTFPKRDGIYFGSLPSSRSNSPLTFTNPNRSFERLDGDFFRVKFTPGKSSFREANRCHKLFSAFPGNEAKSLKVGEEEEDPNFYVDPDRLIEVAGKDGQDLRISVPNDAPNTSSWKCISREQIVSLCLHGSVHSKLSREEHLQMKSVTTVLHGMIHHTSHERSVTNVDTHDTFSLQDKKPEALPQDVPSNKAPNSDGLYLSNSNEAAKNKEEVLDHSCEVTSTYVESNEKDIVSDNNSERKQENSSENILKKTNEEQGVAEENNLILHSQDGLESNMEDKQKDVYCKGDRILGSDLTESSGKDRLDEIIEEHKSTKDENDGITETSSKATFVNKIETISKAKQKEKLKEDDFNVKLEETTNEEFETNDASNSTQYPLDIASQGGAEKQEIALKEKQEHQADKENKDLSTQDEDTIIDPVSSRVSKKGIEASKGNRNLIIEEEEVQFSTVQSESSSGPFHRDVSTSSVTTVDDTSDMGDFGSVKSENSTGPAATDTLDLAVNEMEMAKFDLDELKFEIATKKLTEQKSVYQSKGSCDTKLIVMSPESQTDKEVESLLSDALKSAESLHESSVDNKSDTEFLPQSDLRFSLKNRQEMPVVETTSEMDILTDKNAQLERKVVKVSSSSSNSTDTQVLSLHNEKENNKINSSKRAQESNLGSASAKIACSTSTLTSSLRKVPSSDISLSVPSSKETSCKVVLSKSIEATIGGMSKPTQESIQVCDSANSLHDVIKKEDLGPVREQSSTYTNNKAVSGNSSITSSTQSKSSKDTRGYGSKLGVADKKGIRPESGSKSSEKLSIETETGKSENVTAEPERKSTKRKEIHPEKLLQKALSAVSVRKPLPRLPEDDKKTPSDSRSDKTVKKPLSEKSSVQSTLGSDSKKESKSAGPGSLYKGNNSQVGPTKTLTSDSRRNRQFHPYKKEKKKERKNTWSFDITYNSLRELMQDLTTESYRRLHGRKRVTANKYNTPPRFAYYKFKRSAVPDTLPDSEDEENDDFTEEAIPDFEERKRKADLVEQMMEEGEEDEAYCNEKKVYENDDSKQIQSGAPKSVINRRESVEARLSRIALGDYSAGKDAKSAASSATSSEQPFKSDDRSENQDLRHIITKLKSSCQRSVPTMCKPKETSDSTSLGLQKKEPKELSELAVSENVVSSSSMVSSVKHSSSVSCGVQKTLKNETNASTEELNRNQRKSAPSLCLNSDGYKLIPIDVDSILENNYKQRETFGFQLVTADFWREDPRTLKDKNIFKEDLKHGYKVKGLVVYDTDAEHKRNNDDLCKSENEYQSEVENAEMNESLNTSFSDWIVVDELHGGASDCEVSENKTQSDINYEENISQSNLRKVIIKEKEEKDCSDDDDKKSLSSLFFPETSVVDEESLLNKSSSQIAGIEEKMSLQNSEKNKEDNHTNERKVILKEKEGENKPNFVLQHDQRETDTSETRNLNVMNTNKDNRKCDIENLEKCPAVQESQNKQLVSDSKGKLSDFENECSVQDCGLVYESELLSKKTEFAFKTKVDGKDNHSLEESFNKEKSSKAECHLVCNNIDNQSMLGKQGIGNGEMQTEEKEFCSEKEVIHRVSVGDNKDKLEDALKGKDFNKDSSGEVPSLSECNEVLNAEGVELQSRDCEMCCSESSDYKTMEKKDGQMLREAEVSLQPQLLQDKAEAGIENTQITYFSNYTSTLCKTDQLLHDEPLDITASNRTNLDQSEEKGQTTVDTQSEICGGSFGNNKTAMLTINLDNALSDEDHNFQEIIFATDQQLEDIISVFAIEDVSTNQGAVISDCDICSDEHCQSKISCFRSDDPLEEAMYSSGILDINDIPMGNVIEISSSGTNLENTSGLVLELSDTDSLTLNSTKNVSNNDEAYSLGNTQQAYLSNEQCAMINMNVQSTCNPDFVVIEEIVKDDTKKDVDVEIQEESDDTLTASEMETSQSATTDYISDSEVDNGITSRVNGSDLSVLIVSKSSDTQVQNTSFSESLGAQCKTLYGDFSTTPATSCNMASSRSSTTCDLYKRPFHTQDRVQPLVQTVSQSDRSSSNIQHVSPFVSSTDQRTTLLQKQFYQHSQPAQSTSLMTGYQNSVNEVTRNGQILQENSNSGFPQCHRPSLNILPSFSAMYPLYRPYLPLPIYQHVGISPLYSNYPEIACSAQKPAAYDLTIDHFQQFQKMRQKILGQRTSLEGEQGKCPEKSSPPEASQIHPSMDSINQSANWSALPASSVLKKLSSQCLQSLLATSGDELKSCPISSQMRKASEIQESTITGVCKKFQDRESEQENHLDRITKFREEYRRKYLSKASELKEGFVEDEGKSCTSTVLPPFSTFREKDTSPLFLDVTKKHPISNKFPKAVKGETSLTGNSTGNFEERSLIYQNNIPIGHVKPFTAG